ncbi:MAG: peptidylprolyl isomerase [Pseudomonadota bacterium]
MKKKKLTLAKGISISLFALVLGALAFNTWARNQQDGKDQVLVTVNDVSITRGEVEKRIDAILGPKAKMLPPERLAKIRNQLNGKVLDSMIEETLLTKALEKQNTTVKDEEVEEVLRQLQESSPSGATFEEFLRNMGRTEKDFRESVTKNLRIKKHLEQQIADVAAPTDEEIASFYEENSGNFQVPESVEVRHILIAVNPDDDAAAKSEKMKKAEKIRGQLMDKKGEKFEAIAAEASDCPSKAKGGRLGELVHGQTVKAFEDAAFNQKVGEIGPVVETSFGYHIIEVLDHKEARKVPLSEVSELISNHLLGQKKDKAVREYIDSLRAKASIVFPGEKSGEANPV